MVKVERTYPPPPSLAAKKNYKDVDTVKELRIMFNDKCYLCNIEPTDYNVEHLRPHKNSSDLHLKFDWDNLFLSCPHCNSVKNKLIFDDCIIDCCKEDPEEFLDFFCKDSIVKIISRTNNNKTATMTAKLLTEVFNLTNTAIRDLQSEKRVKELLSEMNVLYTIIDEYKSDCNNKIVHRTLSGLLSRKSQFAAFKRAYVRNNFFDDIILVSYLD